MPITEQLRLLSLGFDPQTGSAFEFSDLQSDSVAMYFASLLAYNLGITKTKPDSINYLARPAASIFADLREWRLNEAAILGRPAYCVFSDAELWQIAKGDICTKEDLLRIKGISTTRYELYGDAIFDIVKPYIA